MISALITTAIRIIIGWILIDKVPRWLGLTGIIATIIKVLGVIVILSALFAWI